MDSLDLCVNENYKCECKPSELCGKCCFDNDKYKKLGFEITTKNKII